MHLAYNGAPFFGWQIQPNHPSVQETLERGLSLLLHCDRIPITGCGRTDTGVHSSCYYAHFDLPEGVTLGDCEQFKDKFNNFLTSDIVIYRIFPVQPQAHARFDAVERTYHYYITTQKDPFLAPLRYFSYRRPNVELMNEAAALLLARCMQENKTVSDMAEAIFRDLPHALHLAGFDNEKDVFQVTEDFVRNPAEAMDKAVKDAASRRAK